MPFSYWWNYFYSIILSNNKYKLTLLYFLHCHVDQLTESEKTGFNV